MRGSNRIAICAVVWISITINTLISPFILGLGVIHPASWNGIQIIAEEINSTLEVWGAVIVALIATQAYLQYRESEESILATRFVVGAMVFSSFIGILPTSGSYIWAVILSTLTSLTAVAYLCVFALSTDLLSSLNEPIWGIVLKGFIIAIVAYPVALILGISVMPILDLTCPSVMDSNSVCAGMDTIPIFSFWYVSPILFVIFSIVLKDKLPTVSSSTIQ